MKELTAKQREYACFRKIEVGEIYSFPSTGFIVYEEPSHLGPSKLIHIPFGSYLDALFEVKEITRNGFVRGNFSSKPIYKDFYLYKTDLAERSFPIVLILLGYFKLINLFRKNMKTLIIACSVLLFSCHDSTYIGGENNYTYAVKKIIPDSLKDESLRFIKEAITGASHKLTTSDYEDPEDVIFQLETTVENIYGKEVEGLIYNYTFIPVYRLTPHQKLIFDKLSKN
jgi:hypothetical protein